MNKKARDINEKEAIDIAIMIFFAISLMIVSVCAHFAFQKESKFFVIAGTGTLLISLLARLFKPESRNAFVKVLKACGDQCAVVFVLSSIVDLRDFNDSFSILTVGIVSVTCLVASINFYKER